MIFKRKIEERKHEETRARAKYTTSYDVQNIKNKLGLPQKSPDSAVRGELFRLKGKSNATWKALKLDKQEVLKRYNIT